MVHRVRLASLTVGNRELKLDVSSLARRATVCRPPG